MLRTWTNTPRVSIAATRSIAGRRMATGKIVFSLLDNTVVAVDAITGKEVWRNHLADPRTGITMTSSSHHRQGQGIQASSSGEMGIRGWIQALDLKTGKSLWRAYSTGPTRTY